MLNANNCWHFNIYDHDKFRSQELNMKKSFILIELVVVNLCSVQKTNEC